MAHNGAILFSPQQLNYIYIYIIYIALIRAKRWAYNGALQKYRCLPLNTYINRTQEYIDMVTQRNNEWLTCKSSLK